MANSWLRLWHEMPNDPKWRTIARVSGQSIPEVLSVYLHLLVDASNADERGRTQPNAEDIASALDMQVAGVEAILKAMESRVIENGHLSGWEKRQPVREDNSAERAKKWRETNRLAEKEESDERNRTQPNATERQDKDKDKDKDKEEIKVHTSTSLALVPISPKAPSERPEEYANFWNSNRGDLPKVTKFTDSRKAKVQKRMAEGLSMNILGDVMNLCTTSDFLTGKQGGSSWKATFDWIMENDKNWVKVVEGNYINPGTSGVSKKQIEQEQKINDTASNFAQTDRIFGINQGPAEVRTPQVVPGQVRALLEPSADNSRTDSGLVRRDPTLHG